MSRYIKNKTEVFSILSYGLILNRFGNQSNKKTYRVLVNFDTYIYSKVFIIEYPPHEEIIFFFFLCKLKLFVDFYKKILYKEMIGLKKKKLNVKNLIKLIIMVICILILVIDYVRLIYWTFNGTSIGFTWYGLVIDFIALFTGIILEQDLFDR